MLYCGIFMGCDPLCVLASPPFFLQSEQYQSSCTQAMNSGDSRA